jgi:hypothetical protein
MEKKQDLSSADPYDLTATLKDRKSAQTEKSNARDESPYSLSYETSLRASTSKTK